MPPDQRGREIEALRERLSRLSEASRRINKSLDFDQVLQGVLDSARFLTGARHGVMTLLVPCPDEYDRYFSSLVIPAKAGI